MHDTTMHLLLPLPRRIRFCLFVCQLPPLRKNFQMDLHEIFREDWQWANEQLIKFWWQSGSLTGHRDCFPDLSQPTALRNAAVQGTH